MRIDDRKVNGSITIDNTDFVAVFNIIIDQNVPRWVFWDHATNGPTPIDPGIVVHDLNRAFRRSPLTMLRFNIGAVIDTKSVYFSPRIYATNANNEIEIDIGELMPNKKLTISLTTGEITLA